MSDVSADCQLNSEAPNRLIPNTLEGKESCFEKRANTKGFQSKVVLRLEKNRLNQTLTYSDGFTLKMG